MIPISQWMDKTKGELHNQFCLYIHIDTCSYPHISVVYTLNSMENLKTHLVLDMKDVVIVKPSKPTPCELLSLSTIDSDPVLNILCHTIYVYKANLDSPNGQLDPAHLIKEALSKVLVYYYPLAGKIVTFDDGKLGINCNADGVPFLEATANCELSSLHYLEGIDVPTAQKLVINNDNPSQVESRVLAFKVTKFLCGGFTIGMGLSHSVCDGFGASVVLTDWRQLSLLEEVDFGWKASVNIIPVPWNMLGYVDLCLFLPPSNLDPSMKGGVRVFVSLPKASMPKFREEMEALKVTRADENSTYQ